MEDITISKNQQTKQFIVNNDIEEVLSGGSIDNGLKIKKIQPELTGRSDLQDKIELSSNKDVDIGLELLVNKDKINKREHTNEAINLNANAHKYNAHAQDNIVDLNKSAEIDFNTMMNNTHHSETKPIDQDLNLDRTSRLSQSEIDAFIDTNDAAVKPQLVNEEDIENLNYFATKSDKISHHSHNDVRSISQKSITHHTSLKDERQYSTHNYDPVKERKEKEEILWQLEKYRRLGIQGVRKYNMSSDVEEMRAEYVKIKKARELESSIKFQRKCIVAFATGTELLNNKLDFLDFKLDGWSEQVNENVDEYNEVFEELHEKYKERAQMAPELKLMLMMGGSAFMFHITNSMFKNSVPGMEDIMKQNPELMKQFANAAINQMDGEKQSAAKFFNNFAPGNNPSFAAHAAGNRPMPTAPEYDRPPEYSRSTEYNRSQEYNRSAPMPPPQPSNSKRQFNNINEVEEITSIRSAFNNSSTKIPEPVGVDDILNELQSNTGDISEITSRSSRNVSGNLSRTRPKRSINLNLN
jgi:hypothetical protein